MNATKYVCIIIYFMLCYGWQHCCWVASGLSTRSCHFSSAVFQEYPIPLHTHTFTQPLALSIHKINIRASIWCIWNVFARSRYKPNRFLKIFHVSVVAELMLCARVLSSLLFFGARASNWRCCQRGKMLDCLRRFMRMCFTWRAGTETSKPTVQWIAQCRCDMVLICFYYHSYLI